MWRVVKEVTRLRMKLSARNKSLVVLVFHLVQDETFHEIKTKQKHTAVTDALKTSE